jgi:hypothetical protein
MALILQVWAADTNSEGVTTLSLQEVFGEDHRVLKKAFDKFIQRLEDRGEECIDSYRIAKITDTATMDFYESFMTCCGSEDVPVNINGTFYMFGANFGH